jgi:hypothetical protein
LTVGLLAVLACLAIAGDLPSIALASTATVHGFVRDSTDDPVTVGEVSALPSGSQKAAATAEIAPDGSYSLTVPTGAYRLVVEAYEYEGVSPERVAGRTESITVTGDLTEDFGIPLRLGSLTVKVVDANDSPVTAKILVRESHGVVEEGTTPQGASVVYSGDGHGPGCVSASECTVPAIAGAALELNAVPVNGLPTGYVEGSATALGSDLVLKLPPQVQIDGVVRDSGGNPVPVGEVSATPNGGQEAATAEVAPDGSYTLNVPAGKYRLVVEAFEYEGLLFGRVSGRTEDLTVMEDLTEDFTIPLQLGSVAVDVVDANGSPVDSKVIVRESHGVVEEGLTPQGAQVVYSGVGHGPGCVSVSECFVRAIAGAGLEFSAEPPNGSPTGFVEATATAGGSDLLLGLENYADVPSRGTVPGTITVSTPPGAALSLVSSEHLDEHALPLGAVPVVGGLAFRVSGIKRGKSTNVTLRLPEGSAPTNVFKLAGGSYSDVTQIAKISGDKITLHLIDGGPEDADGEANGVIVDPVVPARFQQAGPAPTIKHLSEKTGPAAGGSVVQISGSGFSGATGVQFGSAAAAGFTVKSGTMITATAPASTAGTVDVVVTTPNGASATGAKDRFRYEAPTVESVSPGTGSVSGGTSVTVTGTGFAVGAGATVFEFGKAFGGSVSCSSITTCTVVAPPGARPGAVDVLAVVGKLRSKKARPADEFIYG